MSGILGQVETHRAIDPDAFTRMLAALAARGPGGEGTRMLHGGRVALGNRRLAIPGHSGSAAQPISNASGTLWLTFDGEIYNFRELGKQLAAEGHAVCSGSDAEVVLHAYAEWGDDCLLRLRGTFAFGLWDTRRERLLLARDRLGVKPLYYLAEDGGLTFASQPRAILEHPRARREVDPSAFRHCLAYGQPPNDRTVWAGIATLPPGHRLVLDRRGLRSERYWEIRYEPSVRKPADAARLVRAKLEEAVRLQLTSEMPIGVHLSGGIAPPTLAAIAMCALERKLPSFEIGIGETDGAALRGAPLVSHLFTSPAHQARMSADAVAGLLPELIAISDEPCLGDAGLRTLAASRLARSQGVGVMLGSGGADEVFAGRASYEGASPKPQRPWRRLRGATVLPRVTQLQLADLSASLAGDLLPQIDRASLAGGVETRLPFLDHELVEAVFTIDSRVVFAEGESLALLRRAAASWLPPEVLADCPSPGDAVLDARWESGSSSLLPDGVLVSRGLLERDAILALLASERPAETRFLARAELWARHWLEPASGIA